MSRTVAVNPPKTPCTSEPRGVARATIPNICKMPGPPAPFVPMPLPNIGKSSLSPEGYSMTVRIEKHTVAIRGATFKSMGDMASKATGGGLISANTHGPTKFVTPGSMNVKIEGKSVHLLGEPMLNNCAASGSPPNTGATMQGFDTWDLNVKGNVLKIPCDDAPAKCSPGRHKFTKCEQEEICAKCSEVNKQIKGKGEDEQTGPLKSARGSYEALREEGNARAAQLRGMAMRESDNPDLKVLNDKGFKHVSKKCEDELRDKARNSKPPYKGFSVDHRREIQFCGHPTNLNNLKWMSRRPNRWIGGQLNQLVTSGSNKHTGVEPDCCV
ncbi:PAAR-like domain-containing protein [Microvirga sp. 0TCS3.31]